MLRLLARLLLVLAPLGLYAGWIHGAVLRKLARGETLDMVLMLLAGLLLLAVVEGLLFKLYLLPTWARGLSERLYAGHYLPEDDPLARLTRQMEKENRPDLIPELIRMVEADPCRVRAWLELARFLEPRDPAEAARRLLRGAELIAAHNRFSRSGKEDAALLLWRAAALMQKHSSLASQASPTLAKLAEQYPATAYGKLAQKTLES